LNSYTGCVADHRCQVGGASGSRFEPTKDSVCIVAFDSVCCFCDSHFKWSSRTLFSCRCAHSQLSLIRCVVFVIAYSCEGDSCFACSSCCSTRCQVNKGKGKGKGREKSPKPVGKGREKSPKPGAKKAFESLHRC
jgi:hypothetical protein